MRLLLAILPVLALVQPAAAQVLDRPARRAVIESTARLIESRYVSPERGVRIARALRSQADRFTDTDPVAFAGSLTGYLRKVSHDGHFSVAYRSLPPDAAAADSLDSSAELERWYGAGVNHGFEAVRRLEGGVGYLDLRVFAPTEMAGDMAAAAMTLLAQSPALIIDLRQNGGGMGDMVELLAAYILDKPTEISGTYDRPTDRHARSFTPSWVPGRRFGGTKPVFILISRRTFSAAEAFAYDMQAAGRARIIGERSGGGAHPFAYRAIDDRFVLSLPEGRSINPVTGRGWEGTGVVPDVESRADDALNVALKLATASR